MAGIDSRGLRAMEATVLGLITRSVGGSSGGRAADLRAGAGGGWSCWWARQGSAAPFDDQSQ